MNNYYPFENSPLPYAYDALEPFIDAKTMELHHDRHLQTYINNLNNILEEYPELQGLSLTQLVYLSGKLPTGVGKDIRNNAGGVYNHRMYFDQMQMGGANEPENELLGVVENKYGSFENFKETFKKAGLSVFGSGYAWLVLDNGDIKIVTAANQNNPLEKEMCPILTLDVWEHAYYLKHYNERAKYIDDWFNIINWDIISQNYNTCKEMYE